MGILLSLLMHPAGALIILILLMWSLMDWRVLVEE